VAEGARSHGLELKTNPSLEPMKVTLNLSYKDLPYYLKPCFLYLSIFPEDSVISRMRIVRRWVAEGFVEGRRDLSRVIHPAEVSVGAVIKSCRIHDIMLEFCISKSLAEGFTLSISGSCNARSTFLGNAI
jgi:disease resistance protein RPM1